jgi:hypothetical protein
MRVDLANARSPAERRQLAKEIFKSEEAMGLWQAVGRQVTKPARRYRTKRAQGDVRH